MEVKILKGQKLAEDMHGNIYPIEGIELTREATKQKIFYDKESEFYKVAAAEGTKSAAYLLKDNIMLI